jgi:invasion protein IalB
MIQRGVATMVSFTTQGAIAAAAALAIAGASPSTAQQRSTAPQPTPAGKPSQPAADPAQPEPALVYSPWTKICTEAGAPDAKPAERRRVCFTAKEARLQPGLAAVGVALVDPDKDAKKLRVSLPLGMQLPPGTRIVVDQQQPIRSPYLICLSDGCIAEFDASTDLISRLKKGKQLAIQAVNAGGQAIAINLPLDGFAKVVDGPPTDMSAFEAGQRKRDEDLRRRINEARGFVERAREQAASQGGAPAAPQAR